MGSLLLEDGILRYPASVKAVGLYRYLPIDDPESLLDLDVADPRPAGRDLLVEVKAIAVNPVDYKSRAPRAQVETAPKILGWDVAGVVKAVGPEVTLFKPDEAVYYAGSRTRPGGNSELHLVDERIVGRKPRTLGFAEAAALPLTTLTAWEALFDRLGISKSGADGGRSVLMIGGTQKPVDLAPLMQKSVTFAWELMFTRPMFQTADMLAQHQILDETATLVEAGTLKTTATTRLSPINAANLKKAHALLEGGHVVGKIVLEGF